MGKDQQSNQNGKPAKHQLAQIEEQMVETWAKEQTFEKSLERTKDGQHYEFYDGPPFANGLPHYGHVVSSIVKDAVPRYKTMRGYHVPRRFGWDCHGLPAEMKAEQDLDLGSKADIEEYGVQKFVDYCRTSVTEFTKEWEHYVARIGRWVDFDDNYYTMDESYMESVMWAFKQLYEKGLVSEGYKVMPYCPVCETALSHFESRLDDSYRERKDPAVTVRFPLESGENLLAWTTTPWTLPANLAIAVNKDLSYAVMEGNGERVVLAEGAVERYEAELEGYEKVETKKGSDLLGQSYEPPFDYYLGHKNSHVVLHADFVTDEDGTGIAHEAPGFGEEDQVLTEAHGIEVVVPVDKQGNYTDEVKAYVGVNVFDANPMIVDHLKNQGRLFRHEEYEHMYPHCWRTDNPLIYRAVSSWMVDVPSMKDSIVAKNQEINWVPENVKDGAFGKWIEGARVWNVSRDRFWGAPIPIWKTDDGEVLVIGSLEELKERAVDPEKLTDLHKPAIDDVILRTDSGKEAKRVPEVFDCWFESGSMPFAQHNYPFSGEDKLNHPADFIVEYIGQVRGWFYTLHVLSTALFDKPAFTNAISHGVILGNDGRKMSKKLGNYPDLNHVFDSYGADSMRYYLFESPIITGETVSINEKSIVDVQRNVFMTLMNSYRFFKTYADIDGWQPPKELKQPRSEQTLDVWMLSRLNETIEEVTKHADLYDIPKAVRPLRKLIDDISNWYIRRSRRRFWKSENDSDKETAYNVLWYVLMRTNQLLAPWAPFVSDYMYRELASADMPESVHLTEWPTAEAIDTSCLETMEEVREAISEGLAQRADNSIKIRQPLSSITVALKSTIDDDMEALIREETNVKSVTVKTGANLVVELDTKITTELKHEGLARETIRHIQNFRKKSGLNVEDRIHLELSTDDTDLAQAIDTHKDLIHKETLSSEGEGDLEHTTEAKVSGVLLNIALAKSDG